MTNIPPQIQPGQVFPPGNPLNQNVVQLLTGVAVTLATILGSKLTVGSSVDAVRLNQDQIQQDVLKVSQSNQKLNELILAQSEANKRLNEQALGIAERNRQILDQILEKVTSKK